MKVVSMLGLAISLASPVLATSLNPAFSNCANNGGELVQKTSEVGNYFVCSFSNVCICGEEHGPKAECGPWEFLKGTCKPGDCLDWTQEKDANGHAVSSCKTPPNR